MAAPSASLFSRARPGKDTPPKKIRGFMSLPGEVRNMVYAYYFAPSFRCEIAAQGFHVASPQTRTVKLWSGLIYSEHQIYKYETKDTAEQPMTVRISRPLGKYTVVKGLKTNWLASLCALHLVCQQVYIETASILYNKTVFFFDAPKRIDAFLTMVPQTSLNLITKLQLHYNAYGDPLNTCDRIWQDKHLESWSRACKSTSKKLISLKSLEMWVHIPNSAPKFSLREAWLAPLLQFRRLTRTPKSTTDTLSFPSQIQNSLVDVKVLVRTRLSDCSLGGRFRGIRELADACTDLHFLFGHAIVLAILGAREEEAMADFNEAWEGKYGMWKHHLQFARTGW